jgi:hopene-associated glycosyltransferase HpnB
LTLLLDADIELQPGILTSLKKKHEIEEIQFISLMAVLRFASVWELLLMPAFIYFFKMLYPFALSNKPGHKMAAAAGGCILVETDVIKAIGGMESIKDSVIDDCTLAKRVKSTGYKTWVGLTHNVISQRSYTTLTEIWDMVARTAYSQLHYSMGLLWACTSIMLLMYWLPLYGLFNSQWLVQIFSISSYIIMVFAYLPTLRFYSLSPFLSLLMPMIAGLFLLMTWTSAIRFWKGERSRWKGRIYQNI